MDEDLIIYIPDFIDLEIRISDLECLETEIPEELEADVSYVDDVWVEVAI